MSNTEKITMLFHDVKCSIYYEEENAIWCGHFDDDVTIYSSYFSELTSIISVMACDLILKRANQDKNVSCTTLQYAYKHGHAINNETLEYCSDEYDENIHYNSQATDPEFSATYSLIEDVHYGNIVDENKESIISKILSGMTFEDNDIN